MVIQPEQRRGCAPVFGILSVLAPVVTTLLALLITYAFVEHGNRGEWAVFAPGIFACLAGFPAAIVGSVFGVVALVRKERARALAIAGLVLNVGTAVASAPIVLIALGG